MVDNVESLPPVERADPGAQAVLEKLNNQAASASLPTEHPQTETQPPPDPTSAATAIVNSVGQPD